MILFLVALLQRQNPADVFFAIVALLAFFGLLLYYTAKATARLLGWPLARYLAIPLGLDRVAGLLAREAIEWQRDPTGGALLAGSLALLARDRHDEAIAARLAGALAEIQDIGAAGVIASGLLAASRGELRGARELLEGALDLEVTRTPAIARAIACEWLIAEAVAGGEWARAVKLSEEPGVTLTIRGRLLAGVAARFAGVHGPTDAGLWILWAFSPRHAETRPLIERAIATPRVLHRHRREEPPAPAAAAADAGEPTLPEEPLGRALALHAHWSAREPLHLRLVPARLGALARAWDDAYRLGVVRERALARAAALGVLGKAEGIVDAFFAEVADDLADLSEESGVSIAEALAAAATRAKEGASAAEGAPADPAAEAATAPLGPISERAVARLRGRLLGEVEAAAEAMESRTRAERALPSVDEWKEWSRVRQLYERAGHLGGLELRRLMFPQVHRSACNYAVWLWNDRKEYGVSKPIFRWLLAEAEAVGDEAAIELQRRNVGVK